MSELMTMTIKARISALEKAMLDKLQSGSDLDIFDAETRRKILGSCFDGNLDKVQQELKLCNSEEKRWVIVRKYAIHSAKEALSMESNINNLKNKECK